MADLPSPLIAISINDVDISTDIDPYLMSLSIDDFFDVNFTPSKLDMVVDASFKMSEPWRYKDKIELHIAWGHDFDDNDSLYSSGIFYIDYVSDSKSANGGQVYTISAIRADINLGFTYGDDELNFLQDLTIKQALLDFCTKFNLEYDLRLTEDVYMGEVINDSGVLKSEINFDSYADMLKYICANYGYLGNLEGRKLTIYRADTNYSDSEELFYVRQLPEIYNFQTKETFNPVFKEYYGSYMQDIETIISVVHKPNVSDKINNKIKNITEPYKDETSINERLFGEKYKDFYSSFETSISMVSIPKIKAGKVFYLGASYGRHEGFYRCTKATHRVRNGQWDVEIKGFPIDRLKSFLTDFNVGYVGKTDVNNPDSKIKVISDRFAGRFFLLPASRFDDYVRTLNPNYNLNLGSELLRFCNVGVSAYKIKPEYVLAMSLVETDNYTNNEALEKKNPLGLLTNLGAPTMHNFQNWRTGLEAGIQHIFYYTYPGDGDLPPNRTNHDPRSRFVTPGVMPNISKLDGRWSVEDEKLTYRVREKVLDFYKFNLPNENIRWMSPQEEAKLSAIITELEKPGQTLIPDINERVKYIENRNPFDLEELNGYYNKIG